MILTMMYSGGGLEVERVGGTLVQTSLAPLRLPLPERSPPTAASVILTALSVLPQGTARSDRLQFLNEADNVCDYNLKVGIAKQTFFNLAIMFFFRLHFYLSWFGEA